MRKGSASHEARDLEPTTCPRALVLRAAASGSRLRARFRFRKIKASGGGGGGELPAKKTLEEEEFRERFELEQFDSLG